jgi:hypothetical protein
MVEDEAGEIARVEAVKPSAKTQRPYQKVTRKQYPCTQKVTNPTCTHLSMHHSYHCTIVPLAIF